MAESEGKERLSIPVGNLGILVHPLAVVNPDLSPVWSQNPVGSPARQSFINERQRLYANALARFTPVNEGDVLLFMPNLSRTLDPLEDEFQAIRRSRKRYPELLQWPTLLSALRQASAVPQNILLAPNIAGEKGSDPDDLVKLLMNKRRAISEDTSITVGGEWLNACVTSVVLKILTLPAVSRVRIDLAATLDARYFFGHRKNDDEGELMRQMRLCGFNAEREGDYVYVEKDETPSVKGLGPGG